MSKTNKLLLFIISLFLFGIQFSNNTILATSTTSKTSTCTHTVYSTGSPSTYHYTYCKTCGKCKKRTRHSVSRIVNTEDSSGHKTYCSCGRYLGIESHSYYSYSKYKEAYHKAKCSCGYVGLEVHSPVAKEIKAGETVKGTTYSTTEDLDTYHKLVCTKCDEKVGVTEHTWARGNTLAHRCSGCGRVHSKKNDATKGLHYFNIEKISYLGNVAVCEVCSAILKLEYTSDSILPTLPKKEEYTMVGNPNPMQEVSLETDQKIKSNYMPINENGEVIPIDENALRVRTYTHGNYYRHYSKLMGEKLSNISDRVKYLKDSGTVDYIAGKLSELGALGGYNESKKEEVIQDIQQFIKEDANLRWLDTYAVAGVISQLGDFAVESIKTPLLNWFAQDAVIKNTWLAGDIQTLRHDFKGSMTDANNREYTIYFSELPAGKYEIVLSRVLTHGIDFHILSYSLGGITQLINCTLFNKGSAKSDDPSNIKAYVSIAYRDTDGNVILDKAGNIATPIDQIINKIVYSGTSAHSKTYNLTAEMDWTQRAGYRYKGYLVKYGTSSKGNYSIYNNPNEMKVTTDSSVSVTSSFSYSGLRNKCSILL